MEISRVPSWSTPKIVSTYPAYVNKTPTNFVGFNEICAGSSREMGLRGTPAPLFGDVGAFEAGLDDAVPDGPACRAGAPERGRARRLQVSASTPGGTLKSSTVDSNTGPTGCKGLRLAVWYTGAILAQSMKNSPKALLMHR
jgi:hypothetical protein